MNFLTLFTELKKTHSYRLRKTIEGAQGTQIVIDGRSLINFCSNDYLSLANHPEIIKALKRGADKYGVGAGASHLVSGHSKAHQALEEALADATNQERALLFSSGYAANLGVFSALRDELDWTLQDRLNHASLIDANRLINLPIQRYAHNNLDALRKKIQRQSGQGLLATDHIFSMDGDSANLAQIAQIVQPSNAYLLQDDAHGFGIFTPHIPEHSIYMATLGKAAGTMGAFVAGEADFIELLIQKSRPYAYTTAISPALCVATLKSLELIQQGQQRAKLLDNIQFFSRTARALNLPFSFSKSAIQPLIVGANDTAIRLSAQLYDAGFYAHAIRPPTVPKNSARLRITLNANHTKTQISDLLNQLKRAL